MRLTVSIVAGCLGSLLLVSSAHAGRCTDNFIKKLDRIVKDTKRIPKSCMREVEAGEGNKQAIRRICGPTFRNNIRAMEVDKNRMVDMCERECKGELEALGVCVRNKPLKFYLEKTQQARKR